MSKDGSDGDGGHRDNRTVDARRLLQLLRSDDLDAAIDAGLALFVAGDALSDEENARLAAARDRLLSAWAARERYRARAARLARRAAERKAARTVPAAPLASPDGAPATSPAALPADGVRSMSPPALPSAAAAALARARARMAGKP